MPDMLTHHLFGKQVIELMNEEDQKKIRQNLALYYLGCNGPDNFFYYHGASSGVDENRDRFKLIGDSLHEVDTSKMFDTMFEYLKKHYSDGLYSYIMGFIMHFGCDTNCHPFIYSMTGNTRLKPILNYAHKRLEVAIDQYMLEIMEGTTLKKTKPYKILQFKEEDIRVMYPMIAYVVMKVYGIKLGYDEYKESWKDFKKIEFLTSWSTPYVKKAVQWVEKQTNSLPFFSTAIYAPDYKEYDVLNLAHKEWVHPCDEKIILKESFIDLFEIGKKESVEIVNAVDLFLKSGEKNYEALIRNRSFDTNRECGVPVLYWNSIYKDME